MKVDVSFPVPTRVSVGGRAIPLPSPLPAMLPPSKLPVVAFITFKDISGVARYVSPANESKV